MPKLSQETIAIIAVFVAVIGVGVTLGALILTTTGGLRDEIQAVRTEGRADREAIRAEARADREAFEERMARFEDHIIRLTEQQGALGGLVEGLRQRQPTAAGPSDLPPG